MINQDDEESPYIPETLFPAIPDFHEGPSYSDLLGTGTVEGRPQNSEVIFQDPSAFTGTRVELSGTLGSSYSSYDKGHDIPAENQPPAGCWNGCIDVRPVDSQAK